jgi:aarF domain-containing kinase
MTGRLASLPYGLRQTLFSHLRPALVRAPKHPSSTRTYITFQNAYGITKPSRSLFWALPIAGGLVLYFLPKPESVFPALLASPTIIPCNEERTPLPELTINSPYEPKESIVSLLGRIFHDNIWEPLLTTRRFIHLVYLFLPVLLSAPMLLIGNPERALGGDRWGAVWWYGFLTAQMQRAGPTFIKVRSILLLDV